MKKLILLCLIVCAGTLPARAADPGVFTSVRASHDVALETNPKSAFWQGGDPIAIVNDNWGKPVPGYRTEVFSRWTKDNLYLLYVCPYEKLHLKPNPSTTTETNQLWNWDVAEIFIGWDFQNIRRYKEFEISPQGEWVDLDINLDNPHHEDGWKWNSGFQVKARIDRRHKIWYGAMKIPFKAIDPQAPQARTVLRANLFRMQGPPGDQKSLTWQPTMNKSFHVPEHFGRLVLADSR
ncbi:MAG: carbohydrate-binding family 9-like protein [Acidobacteriaceae bacterium]